MNEAALAIIDQHIPSLSDADDDEIVAKAYWGPAGEMADAADLAIRTCACGIRIDGFYEYVDHLKSVLS